MHDSLHYKGPHGYGPLIGGAGTTNVSFHHNLMAHNYWRNPRISAGTIDVVNNIIYDRGTHKDKWSNGTEGDLTKVNAIGNDWISGPSLMTGFIPFSLDAGEFGISEVYVEGNISPVRPTDDLAEDLTVFEDERQNIVDTPFDTPPITDTTAFEAYDEVLAITGAGAGASARLDCSGNFVPHSDQVDLRIIDDVKNITGNIINHPDDVGGWPDIDPGTPCEDTDQDGMADEWENLQFGNLDRGSSDDSSSDFDGDGYTDLEEYFNGTDPKTSGTSLPVPNLAPTVDAGSDLSVTLPNVASLNGTAWDDGLPNPPGELTLSWSLITGPDSVTFESMSSSSTTVSFPIAGVYILRFTADDSELSTEDDLIVTVLDSILPPR